MKHTLNTNKLCLCILALALLVILVAPTEIFAVGNPAQNLPATYTPLEPLPCVPGGGITCSGTSDSSQSIDFQTYVQQTFNLVIALAAAAAVFMIVWGGFTYMTTDSVTGKSSGLDKVRKALLGLLLILCSYLLLRTIDPRLVAIPTTLVKPLDITYENTTNAFLSTLDSNMNTVAKKYGVSDAQLEADLQSANQAMGTLDTMETGLVSQICRQLPVGVDCDPTSICNDPAIKGNPSDKLYPLCQGLNNISTQQSAIKAQLAGETAQNAFDALFQTCSDGNVTACKLAVNSWRDDFATAMAGQGIDTKKVYDNASYTNAMLDMYDTLSKYNPVAAGITNLIQAKNDLRPGGGLLTSVQNWFIPDSESTAKTINKIQSIVDGAQISDPTVKAHLNEQLEAIKAQLNGNPPPGP